MKPYKGLVSLGFCAFLLASCASQPPNLSNTSSGSSITIQAKEIVVADFMREHKYNPRDTIWSSSFHPLPISATVPSFPELVINNLRNRLRGNNESNDVLNIYVLDSRILMESRVADSIPLIGIASALSERKYMCVVDVNIIYRDKTIRNRFDATYTKSRAWPDIPTDEKGEMIASCLNQIVEDIAGFSLSVMRN